MGDLLNFQNLVNLFSLIIKDLDLLNPPDSVRAGLLKAIKAELKRRNN